MYRKGMRGFGGFDATTLDPSIILMGLNQADHTNPQVGVSPSRRLWSRLEPCLLLFLARISRASMGSGGSLRKLRISLLLGRTRSIASRSLSLLRKSLRSKAAAKFLPRSPASNKAEVVAHGALLARQERLGLSSRFAFRRVRFLLA